MATISKFYLHDVTSPNTGTMPSNSPGWREADLNSIAVTGDATGASTARDATDVIGTANPDTESQITSNADTNTQVWGHRRFVSRPLAAQSIPFNNPTGWTFSYARLESSLNHNQGIFAHVYAWRPSTGAQVGSTPTNDIRFTGTEPTSASTEQAQSLTGLSGTVAQAIVDGDILVFDVCTVFTQSMNTAYTDNFCYDGTTEASTTTCATFITPPAALTLASTVHTRQPAVHFIDPAIV